jgi:hypothetical protein
VPELQTDKVGPGEPMEPPKGQRRWKEEVMTQEDMTFFEKLFRSLESEMKNSFEAVNARLDQTNARLERIGGLVNGGSRAIARMIDWSEKTDVSLAEVLRRQQALEDRVRELERKRTE